MTDDFAWRRALPPPKYDNAIQQLPDFFHQNGAPSNPPPMAAVGMPNDGFTEYGAWKFSPLYRCYQNAVIQTLLHYPRFAHWLSEHHHAGTSCLKDSHAYPGCSMKGCEECCKVEDCITCYLRRIQTCYWTRRSTVDGPSLYAYRDQLDAFIQKRALQGRSDDSLGRGVSWDSVPGDQEDVFWFFFWLKEQISTQLPMEGTKIGAMFSALEFRERGSCRNAPNCQKQVNNKVIADALIVAGRGRDGWNTGENMVEYLAQATGRECLEDFKCDECDTRQDIYCDRYILDYPDLVLIKLEATRVTQAGDIRINRNILDIPGSIDLSSNSAPSSPEGSYVYKLHAVIAHQGGTSTECGHYKTILHDADGNWVEFNDELLTGPMQVDETDTNHIMKERELGYPPSVAGRWSRSRWSPYLLFYRRDRSGNAKGKAPPRNSPDSKKSKKLGSGGQPATEASPSGKAKALHQTKGRGGAVQKKTGGNTKAGKGRGK